MSDEFDDCPTCGAPVIPAGDGWQPADDDDVGCQLSRIESDMYEIHGALEDAGLPGAINAQSILERIAHLVADRDRPALSREAMIEAGSVAHYREYGPTDLPFASAPAWRRAMATKHVESVLIAAGVIPAEPSAIPEDPMTDPAALRPAQAALLSYMEHASEERWCAGWLNGLETELAGDPTYDWLVQHAGGTWSGEDAHAANFTNVNGRLLAWVPTQRSGAA